MFRDKKKSRDPVEINAGSMADIAFLLLIFFLVTTTIVNDKGMPLTLPKFVETPPEKPKPERNVFKVLINSQNKLLVEDEPMEISNLKKEAILFYNNNKKNPSYSDNPVVAVVSLRADRLTSYETYITVLDELKASTTQLRAAYLDITSDQYLDLLTRYEAFEKKYNRATDKKSPEIYSDISLAEIKSFEEANNKFPGKLSIAEPSDKGMN